MTGSKQIDEPTGPICQARRPGDRAEEGFQQACWDINSAGTTHFRKRLRLVHWLISVKPALKHPSIIGVHEKNAANSWTDLATWSKFSLIIMVARSHVHEYETGDLSFFLARRADVNSLGGTCLCFRTLPSLSSFASIAQNFSLEKDVTRLS